jgi:hypothetical protein
MVADKSLFMMISVRRSNEHSQPPAGDHFMRLALLLLPLLAFFLLRLISWLTGAALNGGRQVASSDR